LARISAEFESEDTLGKLMKIVEGRLKNYLALCQQNVRSLWDFSGQLRASYFCTIPNNKF